MHSTLDYARDQSLFGKDAKGVWTPIRNFGTVFDYPGDRKVQFPWGFEADEGRPSWPPWSLHVVLRSAAGSTSVKSVSSLCPKAGIRVVSSSEWKTNMSNPVRETKACFRMWSDTPKLHVFRRILV